MVRTESAGKNLFAYYEVSCVNGQIDVHLNIESGE
jgi:hypothetical protein